MNNNQANWILKNNGVTIPSASFPYAFRSMWNSVRKGIEDKKPVNTKEITIVGPPNLKGERTTYSYNDAVALAREQGLLNAQGEINSKEFKKR